MTSLAKRFPTVVLLAALLAVSACGPAGTRPITKIGLQAPFMGFDEQVGYSVIGQVRQVVADRNLAGGVSGYSVEPVALDDGNLAGQASQRAREMIIDPAVMAVLGGFDGDAAVAAAGEYAQAGTPFVTLSSSDALTTALRLVATDSQAGQHAAEFAVQSLGARRIVMLSESPAGQDALGDAFTSAAQAAGATVSRVPIERWQLDFSHAVGQAAAASPDLVFFAGRAAEAGEFLKQMRSSGLTATFLGGPATDDARLAQIAGPAAEGAYYVSLGYPLSEVADPALRAKLEASAARPAGAYSALAYDGTQVLLDAVGRAIKAHGKPTRQAVAEALRATKYSGASGEISFDAQGNRNNPPWGIYRILNARSVRVQ